MASFDATSVQEPRTTHTDAGLANLDSLIAALGSTEWVPESIPTSTRVLSFASELVGLSEADCLRRWPFLGFIGDNQPIGVAPNNTVDADAMDVDKEPPRPPRGVKRSYAMINVRDKNEVAGPTTWGPDPRYFEENTAEERAAKRARTDDAVRR